MCPFLCWLVTSSGWVVSLKRNVDLGLQNIILFGNRITVHVLSWDEIICVQWAFNLVWLVSLGEGLRDTQRKQQVTLEAESRVVRLRIWSHHQKLGKGEEDPIQNLSRSTVLPVPGFWTSNLRTEREYISVVLRQPKVICYDNTWKLIRYPSDLNSTFAFWRKCPNPPGGSICMFSY